MKKYIIGSTLLVLYFANPAHALLKPIYGTSVNNLITKQGIKVDENFFRSIITADNFSSFAFIEENGITYCYAIINVGTLNAQRCKGIYRIALIQNKGKSCCWEYIQPPSIDKTKPLNFIPENRKPFLTKLGEHIVLVTRLQKGEPKKVYAYDASNNAWSEKCELSPELTGARLHYITGTHERWWIKGCNKERLACNIKEIQTPKDFFKEKSFLEGLNPLSSTLKSHSTPYTDVSLAPDGHTAWFIERNQDSNPKKQNYVLKIIDLNDHDEDEEFIQKSSLTSSENINFSSLHNFVAIDDKKAFFVDSSKKNLYSVTPRGNARLCETTQKPIDTINTVNDTLIVAMGQELYQYLPSPRINSSEQTNTLSTTAFPVENIDFEPISSTESTITNEVSLKATPAEGTPLITQRTSLDIKVPEQKIENAKELTTLTTTPKPTSFMPTVEDKSGTKKERVQSKTSSDYNYLSKIIAQRKNQAGIKGPLPGYTDELQLEPKKKSLDAYYMPTQKAADTYYNKARAWIQNVTTNLWNTMW